MVTGANDKRRVLIPIVGQGSITHIIRTGILQRLSEFITPVVAILWNEKDLVQELAAKGFEVHLFPQYAVSDAYNAHRGKINLWYKKFRIKTPSFKIQETYLQQFRKSGKRRLFKHVRTLYYETRFAMQPGYAEKLISREAALIKDEPAFSVYANWLREINIEGLFTVTPFLPEVDLVARILKQQNIPIIASIHSFDNVTKRGWQSVVFDEYIVWNKYNKAELERIYPALKNRTITIAGAPQFDFHYDENFAWSEEEWRDRLNIPTGKRVILYAGGPVSLLPDEPQYLLALKQAYDAGKLPVDSVVLFRCHPLDRMERWKAYVGASEHIIYDAAPNGKEKLDYVNVNNDDIIKLISTLKYADVHINVVSTMTVDGSAFHKPQIGPYYDEVNPSNEELFRKMYYQEHYVPIMNSKVVNLAKNKEEYIQLVNDCLNNPSAYNEACNACVEEIITYRDGRSSERAVAAIKHFFAG